MTHTISLPFSPCLRLPSPQGLPPLTGCNGFWLNRCAPPGNGRSYDLCPPCCLPQELCWCISGSVLKTGCMGRARAEEWPQKRRQTSTGQREPGTRRAGAPLPAPPFPLCPKEEDRGISCWHQGLSFLVSQEVIRWGRGGASNLISSSGASSLGHLLTRTHSCPLLVTAASALPGSLLLGPQMTGRLSARVPPNS